MTVSVWVGNTDVSPALATPSTVCVKYQLTVNVCSPGVRGWLSARQSTNQTSGLPGWSSHGIVSTGSDWPSSVIVATIDAWSCSHSVLAASGLAWSTGAALPRRTTIHSPVEACQPGRSGTTQHVCAPLVSGAPATQLGRNGPSGARSVGGEAEAIELTANAATDAARTDRDRGPRGQISRTNTRNCGIMFPSFGRPPFRVATTLPQPVRRVPTQVDVRFRRARRSC